MDFSPQAIELIEPCGVPGVYPSRYRYRNTELLSLHTFTRSDSAAFTHSAINVLLKSVSAPSISIYTSYCPSTGDATADMRPPNSGARAVSRAESSVNSGEVSSTTARYNGFPEASTIAIVTDSGLSLSPHTSIAVAKSSRQRLSHTRVRSVSSRPNVCEICRLLCPVLPAARNTSRPSPAIRSINRAQMSFSLCGPR